MLKASNRGKCVAKHMFKNLELDKILSFNLRRVNKLFFQNLPTVMSFMTLMSSFYLNFQQDVLIKISVDACETHKITCNETITIDFTTN